MNPIADNALESRADFARAAVDLWRPLKSHFSPGSARVSLGRTAAHFTNVAAELEGFSRPLFGLAPLAAGGLPFDDWELFREGYTNGTNPEHAEYWGVPGHRDQRIVESAALAFGLLLAPNELWDPLDQDAKTNVVNWLKYTLTQTPSDNNWHFFHVLVSLGLELCDVDHDLSIRESDLKRLEEFWLGDGWYSDGAYRRFDHYVPFAMHFYGLIYAKMARGDDARRQRFRERAAEFAQEFQHWFDADGAVVALGRSMTYRFAQCSFWAGLAFADVEALPWGEVKGIWARHLRWWNQRDWYDRDGIMSVGYAYPNLHMSEQYNSPGSPYWAMKAFLPLALPESHPFWSADEAPKAKPDDRYVSTVAGQLGYAMGESRVILQSCNECRALLGCGPEKYGKFAYSSTFGFSVDPDQRGFLANPFDNMLALSRDGLRFVTRTDIDDARIGDDFIWSRWKPDDGIEIETWLIARAPWHLRVHRIQTDLALWVTEGGFAIERTDTPPVREEHEDGRSLVVTNNAASIALDLSTPVRKGVWRKVLPRTSLTFPQTHVPHLAARLEPGETWLAGAFAAACQPELIDPWIAEAPILPEEAALIAWRDNGRQIVGLQNREVLPSPSW